MGRDHDFRPDDSITNVGWDGTNTIVDAEIRFNAAYSTTVTAFDATATHEVGHSLGLQHSDVANQVMSGPPLTSYSGVASLQADDIAGCVHLYGAPAGGGSPPVQDEQAPSIPSNLVATAVNATQVNLTWTASTDNVSVTKYNVYVGGSLIGSATSASASVTGLAPGGTYSFKVSACDAAGNCSGQSNAASASTPSNDSQAPTVPMNLVASPYSTTQISLSWSASTDNVGVALYRVYMDGSALGTSTATTGMANALSPGTTHSFNVAACDAVGNCSAQSNTAMATTIAAAPTCAGSQPANDTQTLACPAGEVGLLTQSRSYSCVGTTWTPSAYQTVSNNCVASSTQTGTTTSYQDMWWAGSNENGWGLTITQHTNALFLAWYIYDANGNPMWIVLPSGTWNAAHTTYTGALYVPSGSWFGNYDTSQFAANASVGTASVTFSSSSAGSLVFTVNGVTTTKSISRLSFGVVNPAPITDYTDMWWGGSSQNGWGVVLSQQYHNIFAAWYTYDSSGRTTWYVMPDGTWTNDTYSGTLYSTRSKPVIGAAYDPSALVVTAVGTLSLTFVDANNATMAYTVNGVTQTKTISRLAF